MVRGEGKSAGHLYFSLGVSPTDLNAFATLRSPRPRAKSRQKWFGVGTKMGTVAYVHF